MPKVKSIVMPFLMLCLTIFILIPDTTAATPDEVKWSRVNIPGEGRAGNWVLADGSDIKHLAIAIDGTLYASATPSGTSYTLFKSTDDGHSWSYTGKVKDSIVDIATAPDDANAVCYATSSDIYQSTDAGSSFSMLPSSPGGAGSNNIEITSIAIAPPYSRNTIVVGTKDTDESEFGGIHVLDEEQALPGWQDTGLSNYDVYDVVFSPNFVSDHQTVAVVTDETDTVVTFKVGDANWGATIGSAILDKDNSGIPTSVTVNTSADIAFPSDYDADSDIVLFAGINTGDGSGDVYLIEGAEVPDSSQSTDLNVGSAYGADNVDTTKIAVMGSGDTASILAGMAAEAQVYYSHNGGQNWKRSKKWNTNQR